VVENLQNMLPIGVVTDRDIVCRAIALGKNPLALTVADCMSNPVITVSEDATLEKCCRLFEEHLVRRMPVVDAGGRCCGIISQADVAQYAPEEQTADVVREISRPSDAPSRVAADD
jgi:CBS domain-containing protein